MSVLGLAGTLQAGSSQLAKGGPGATPPAGTSSAPPTASTGEAEAEEAEEQQEQAAAAVTRLPPRPASLRVSPSR
jgi:hypothetical protein